MIENNSIQLSKASIIDTTNDATVLCPGNKPHEYGLPISIAQFNYKYRIIGFEIVGIQIYTKNKILITSLDQNGNKTDIATIPCTGGNSGTTNRYFYCNTRILENNELFARLKSNKVDSNLEIQPIIQTI